MKLGISRPRTQEYRPRPIDGKATKQARTRHAAGVARLQAAFRQKPYPIPAPGQRAEPKRDPEEARARRKRIGSWTILTLGHGRAKRLIRRGVSVGQSPQGQEADREPLNRRARRAGTFRKDRVAPRQMPSMTADQRRRGRKAARKARKANRR